MRLLSTAKPACFLAGVFYGWWIVLSHGVLNVMSAGFFFYGLSTFFVPLTRDFGWSYALTSSAFSLHQLGGTLIAPLSGIAFDRLGPRKLVMFAATMAGAGFFVLSLVNSFAAFALAVSIMAIGFHSGLSATGMATVANWFSRKRTTALGLLMAGAGLGGLLVPIVAWAIETHGWRTAAMGIAIVLWLVCFPLSLVLRHRPEAHGLLPDGDPPTAAGKRPLVAPVRPPIGSDVIQADLGVRQALRSQAFWLLSISAALSFVAQSAVMVHLIPRLDHAGMPATVSASVLSALMIISIAGRIGFGWLGDRMSKRYVTALVIALQAAGLCVFANLTETWQLALFLLLYAPSYGGAIPLRPSMLAEYVGRRSFGSIQGLFMACMSLGGMVGPVLAGWTFDVTGSYTVAIWILAAVTVAALPPTLALPKPPEQ